MDTLTKKLFKAAKQNNTEKVRSVVEKTGVLTTATNSKGRTIGHIAVRNANFNMLKYVVEKDASILKMVDDNRYNIFHLTVKLGALDMVKYMVEKYDVDVYEKFKRDSSETGTALHRAVKYGHSKMVKYFIEERNVRVDGLLEDQNQSPLFLAVKYKHLDIVKYLVDKNANLTLIDHNEENILFQTIRNGDLKLLKYFLDEKKAELDINWRNNRDDTLVLEMLKPYPLSDSTFELLKYLVEQKHADVNISSNDTKKGTALHRAVWRDTAVSKYLIEHGADVNARNYVGQSILFHIKSEDMCKFALKHGADINQKDYSGQSPLIKAMEHENYAMSVCLLEEGANWNQLQRPSKVTPLDLALKLNTRFNAKLIEHLVKEKKIDLNTPDEEGKTPLHRAALNENLEVCRDLIYHHDVDVNRQDKDGNTALHYAVSKNNVPLCEYLVANGAALIKNSDGETPVQIAESDSLKNFLEKFASERRRRSVHPFSASPSFDRTLLKFEERQIDGNVVRRVGSSNNGTPTASSNTYVIPLQNFFLLAQILIHNMMNSKFSQKPKQFSYIRARLMEDRVDPVVEDAIGALPDFEVAI